MLLIVIPHDYEDQGLVPICIDGEDCYGRPLGSGWIEACVGVASRLRTVSRRILKDEWRVSELADDTLQSLAASRGTDYGTDPGRLILTTAEWLARDKRAGDRRVRRGLNVELFDSIQGALRDPTAWGDRVEGKVFCDRLLEALQRDGRGDLSDMMNMYLADHDPAEIRNKFGLSRSGFSHRFWRGLRKAAGLL